MTSDRTERLPGKKPRFNSVLEKLRRKRQLKAPSAIERLPRDGGELPLASNQQRLWLIHQLHPGSGAYNIGMTVELRGDLDRWALREAFQKVMERHESLRTAFDQRDGVPFQVVQKKLELAMPLIDLGTVPTTRSVLIKHILQIRSWPFDLRRAPLLRIVLLKRSPSEHILVVGQHHIVGDGWSVSILIRETLAYYRALLDGNRPQLPTLPIQYADYVAWQKKTFDQAAIEASLEFWRRHLAGSPPVLELPGDRPRPAIRSPLGALHPIRFSPPLAASLRQLARSSGTTLYVVLMAAFQSLLLRVTGQRDFVIGSPIANRDRVEVQNLIGFFANTLALRTQLRSRDRFADLLSPLHELMLEAHRHQSIPFERLVEELQPERTLSYTPIFQVLFSFRNIPLPVFELPGLVLKQLVMGSGTVNFDLSLNMEETEERLTGYFEYSKDLFDSTTITRLGKALNRLLESVSTGGDSRRLAELPLLGPTELHQITEEWNDTGAPSPGKHLAELFEEQSKRTPDAVAVVCGPEALSYSTLDLRAEALARQMRLRKVGPGILVGIALERGTDLPVALLAVLKSGGAYVPLDVDYPPQRLVRMLNGVSLLVTHGRWAARLEEAATGAGPRAAPQILKLEAGSQTVVPSGVNPPPSTDREILPEHLVYVLYTSGSTGAPKGAAIYLRGFLNLLTWFLSEFEIGTRDRLLLVSSFSFDLTQRNLFAALLTGGELHLPPPGPFDPRALAGAIARQRITVVNATPSAFDPILEAAGESAFSALASLRRVFLGGEALPPGRLAPWLTAASCRAKVVNTYGPTECTAIATRFPLDPARAAENAVVPIGRPISRAAALVLSNALERCPIGVVGELFITGAGVAMGYLAKPALTAERFMPHPFAREPGQRLYRTGDLVCTRPDGALMFLGRVDNQVKVRGFRIELEEIEAALSHHSKVRAAAVIVYDKPPGNSRLTAYIVREKPPRTGSAADDATREAAHEASWGRLVADLRRDLGAELPAYMLPSVFAELEQLPMTPNGKVDRSALPVPDMAETGETASQQAPRTPQEELVAGIWSEVLSLPQVGIDESFFDLGGHSLLATRVVSRLRALFQVDIPLPKFFAEPTVAALAAQLEDASAAASGRESPIVPEPGAPGTPPLSFSQERFWFLDRLMPRSSAYNVASFWRLRGNLDAGSLEQALGEVVRRHHVLRTVFPSSGGEPRPLVQPASSWAGSFLDLTALGSAALEEARRGAEREVNRPFSIEHGPLVRGLMWRITSTDHVLLLVMHHIASDGWSSGILMREVVALYTAFRQGEPSPLEPLAAQYGDFARWQRGWLAGAELERQLDFWRRQLSGSPEVLELPLDRPRPARQTYRGQNLELRVPPALVARLAALARRRSATLYMTLLGTFAVLLGRLSGQEDIVVGSPVAGRTRPEIEDLIGCFINTLPLRIQLGRGPGSTEPSFHEILDQVRETALGGYGHQDLPFEKLVSELALRRNLSHAPLCQVMLALQNTPSQEARLPGLEITPLELPSSTVRFDLSLGLREVEGGLRGSLRYSSDLFETTTIHRFARQLLRLLEAVADEAPLSWRRLPLMSAAEEHQILVEWSQGEPPPPSRPFPELFAELARRRPEAIALRGEGRALSYRELDRRASLLAAHLRSLGLAPEARVGLYLSSSVAFVVGTLGAFKAGSAFVPLEPSHPAERLRFLVQDASIGRIVRDDSSPELPSDLASKAIHLDRLPEARGPAEGHLSSPASLAYVLYTSGSTGQPKGVMIEHRSLTNYLSWVNRTLLGSGMRRLPATSRPSFDAALKQLLAPLASGGEVWLPSAGPATEPAVFLDEIRRERGTVLNGVPALWRLLLERLEPNADGLGLRRLLLGGEALSRELVERTRRIFPEIEIWNLYGPTEATANATAARVEAGRAVSLGQPIAGARAFVLDRDLCPVAMGHLGELCLAGPGLARGYFGRPSLTARKFVPCPASASPGERLYRTGDLVRFLPHGELDFRGRIDQQIKVRGLRIEPGEIESALLRHGSVREAVVVARSREGSPEDRNLLAYLVGGPPQPPQELRRHLLESLPEHMVPAAFVWLEALPLTATGKLDRSALPAPEALDRGELKMPGDEMELRLIRIWEELLGTRPIGVDESFFDLGGHSILAVRLLDVVERAFGVELALSDLFSAPSVARLATLVRRQGAETTASPLVELQRGRSRRPFFCVHPVGGNVFCYMGLVRHLSSERPFHALQCLARETEERSSLEAMATRYLDAVRRVQPSGPYALGGWSMGGVVAFEMARQLEAANEEVAFLGMIDAGAPRRATDDSPLDERTLLARFAGDLAGLSNSDPLSPEALPGLDPQSGQDRLLEHIRRHVGLGEEIGAARIHELYGLFRGNLELLLRYSPGIYHGPVDYFRSADTVHPDQSDPTRGWRLHVRGTIQVHQIPGDHYSVLREPRVRLLAKRLESRLEHTEAGG